MAMKPFSSGPREDGSLFFELVDRKVPLSILNPFHFRQSVAPLVAARKERRRVQLSEVLKRVRSLQAACDILLVEGAGGIHVPLGTGYMVSDLIARLRCPVIVVAQNKLGAINHSTLTVRALNQTSGTSRVNLVLMNRETCDASASSNRKLLRQLLTRTRIWELPYLAGHLGDAQLIGNHARHLRRSLDQICAHSILS